MKRGRNGAYDWRQTISRTRSAVETETTSWGWYREGVIATPLGYVRVYSQDGHSYFRAIVDGVEYVHNESRSYTSRGLAIVAAKFIARLVEEVGS